MEEIHITKRVVDSLSLQKKGQIRYRDTKLIGFGLRVGQKKKAYFAERRVNGKTVRVTIGTHGQITAEQARKMAQELLSKMALGHNPIEQKRANRTSGITLQEVFKDFKETRKSLKPKTLYDYERLMNLVFHAWRRKPITSITKDMVERKHKKLGEEHGKAYANLAMRFLRSLFNFAIGKYDGLNGESAIKENPVSRLSQTKAWYKVKRRENIIKPNEMKNWYLSVINLSNQTLRDYLLLILFTGLRRREAESLRWDQVNFDEKTMTIFETKNSESLTLPLSDYTFQLLQKRKKASVSDYVFPADSKVGHIVEPRSQMRKVTEETGINFSVHDLRRTFISLASSLVTAYELKQLVNHKVSGDVTAGYIIPDPERLREPMQKITSHLLKLSK